MTCEEKAEENYTKVYLNGDMSLDTEEKYFAYTKGYCKGYKDGLAEGRKDRNCVNCSNHGKQFEVMKLTKENEQLKYNLKCRDDELAESKAEIKQIIERERVVPEHYLIEMIEKYKELKAQIEKMKCCQNCKNKKGWKGEKPCLDCKFNQFGEDTEDKWELAE